MKKVLPFMLAVTMMVSLFTGFTVVHAAPTPVVYYNFEGDFNNSTGTDYVGKPNSSTVKFEDKGAVGKAVNLNGGYIEIQNSKNIKFNKQVAMAVWVKFTNTEPFNPVILAKPDKEGELNGAPFCFSMGLGYTALGSSITVVSKDGEEESENTWEEGTDNYMEESLLKERWHHLAISFDGEKCSYYVDGQLASEREIDSDIANFTQILDSGKNLYLGKGDEKFLGLMDEFKLFNQSLSPEDAAALATEGRKQLNNKIELKLENPNMIVDGAEKEIDTGRGTVPYVDPDSNRTLVPIRAIVEEMGGTIGWDPDDQNGRVDITLGDTNIKIWLKNKNAQVNGKPLLLDVVPRTMNDRTMLPLRFVTENLGAEVDWKEETNEIIIRFAK